MSRGTTLEAITEALIRVKGMSPDYAAVMFFNLMFEEYVIVPKNPTSAMLTAGARNVPRHEEMCGDEDIAMNIYCDMISTALEDVS